MRPTPHPPEQFGPDLPTITVHAPTGEFEVQPLVPAPPKGWVGPAVGEWVLEDATIADRHPFDELNYVIEGELSVRAAGSTVTAGPGQVIRVRAGTAAEYSASGRARMLYVYGDNARGLASEMVAAADPAPTSGVPGGGDTGGSSGAGR
jgi:mannose-6-phosphate isomerase-like protein (cupin superfamily)